MELAQLVAIRVEEVSHPLREEVASLKLLLASVGVSLDPREPCSTGGQDVTTVQASIPLGFAEPKLSVVEITLGPHELCGDSSGVPELLELSGGVDMARSVNEVRSESHEILIATFSSSQTFGFEKSDIVDAVISPSPESDRHVVPYVPVSYECEDIDEIIVPVMKIMPELHELSGEPSPPLSMEHLQVVSLGTPMVASASPSMEPSHLGDKVDETSALALNSEAIPRELRDLAASLEAAIQGSSKEIACLLAEKTSGGKIKKVKEYLRNTRKKSGVTTIESTVA
jgi:hypothetical protein